MGPRFSLLPMSYLVPNTTYKEIEHHIWWSPKVQKSVMCELSIAICGGNWKIYAITNLKVDFRPINSCLHDIEVYMLELWFTTRKGLWIFPTWKIM